MVAYKASISTLNIIAWRSKRGVVDIFSFCCKKMSGLSFVAYVFLGYDSISISEIQKPFVLCARSTTPCF